MSSTGKLLGLAAGALAVGGAVAWASGRKSEGGVFLVRGMRAGAFDQGGLPDAAVVVPPGFRLGGPLDVAVYWHGFGNCVSNVIEDHDTPCTRGGERRHASHLTRQFLASGVHAVLVVPELRVELRTGDPGRLGRAGGLPAFFEELFGAHLARTLGAYTGLRHVAQMAHSGGYTALARGIEQVPTVDVALVDALYGDAAIFGRWLATHKAALAPSGIRRLSDLYTPVGGTADHSRALASEARRVLGPAGALTLYDRDASGPLPSDAILRTRGAVFARVNQDHTALSRTAPEALWRTAPAFGRI